MTWLFARDLSVVDSNIMDKIQDKSCKQNIVNLNLLQYIFVNKNLSHFVTRTYLQNF